MHVSLFGSAGVLAGFLLCRRDGLAANLPDYSHVRECGIDDRQGAPPPNKINVTDAQNMAQLVGWDFQRSRAFRRTGRGLGKSS